MGSRVATNVVEGYNLSIDWEQALPSEAGTFKYGTSIKGSDKIYATNSTDENIWEFSKDGATGIVASGTTPFAITADEAGNLIWNNGGGSSYGYSNFYVLPAGKTAAADIVKVTLSLPDDLSTLTGNLRVDQLGRVLGNIMSTEGAYLMTAINLSSKISSYKIAEGKQVASYASVDLGSTIGTNYIAQPNVQTLAEALKNPAMSAYVYIANDGSFYTSTATEWKSIARQNKRSSNGFDWFKLGDETFYVYGAALEGRNGSLWNANDIVVVRASDNAVVAQYQGIAEVEKGGTTGSVVCHAIDANTATISLFSSVAGAAQLTFTVPAAVEPEPAKLYAAGQFQGWNPSAPLEFAYVEADDLYTLTIGAEDALVDALKISTTKSPVPTPTEADPNPAPDWAEFNKGTFETTEAITESGSTVSIVEKENSSNITLPWAGVWTITVDLANKTLTATTETPQPEVKPEYEFVYMVGNAGDNWTPETPVEIPYVESEGVFKLENVNFTNGSLTFKLSTAKGDWNTFNAGGICIADDATVMINTQTRLYVGASSDCKFEKVGTYTVVIDAQLQTILLADDTTGIEEIEAENNVPAVYYNLQGVEVANPENGLYIRVQGNKATKVLVK